MPVRIKIPTLPPLCLCDMRVKKRPTTHKSRVAMKETNPNDRKQWSDDEMTCVFQCPLLFPNETRTHPHENLFLLPSTIDTRTNPQELFFAPIATANAPWIDLRTIEPHKEAQEQSFAVNIGPFFNTIPFNSSSACCILFHLLLFGYGFPSDRIGSTYFISSYPPFCWPWCILLVYGTQRATQHQVKGWVSHYQFYSPDSDLCEFIQDAFL